MSFLKSSSFNVLYTKDLVQTENFYSQIGGEIRRSEKDSTVIGLGGFNLHRILAESELFEEYRYIAESSEYGSGNIFYIETDNIEETYDLVNKAGGKIKSEIKENHWECKEFLFEDPNGYKFAIFQ